MYANFIAFICLQKVSIAASVAEITLVYSNIEYVASLSRMLNLIKRHEIDVPTTCAARACLYHIHTQRGQTAVS